MAREPVTVVLDRHTPELMSIPGVVGTGEGRERDETVFVIFVERRSDDLDARLPKQLDSYPVVIRETGRVRALGKP